MTCEYCNSIEEMTGVSNCPIHPANQTLLDGMNKHLGRCLMVPRKWIESNVATSYSVIELLALVRNARCPDYVRMVGFDRLRALNCDPFTGMSA
jgi:hypothetical protein